MLTFTTLASGSGGNAALVSCANTHILLDAGISARRLAAGLRTLGLEPEDLAAVFITHEHTDHVSGLPMLARRLRGPIYATPLTGRVLCRRWDCLEGAFQEQEAGSGVQVGALWVESFPTSHDAADSVGYSVSGAGSRLALCTDLGRVTDRVLRSVLGAHAVILETNHDEDWVRTGPYPYSLQRRILGDRGHLSNEAGAELALQAVRAGAKTVVLAHLSQQNNTPRHALDVVERRLRGAGVDLEREVTLLAAPRSEPGQTLAAGKAEVLC